MRITNSSSAWSLNKLLSDPKTISENSAGALQASMAIANTRANKAAAPMGGEVQMKSSAELMAGSTLGVSAQDRKSLFGSNDPTMAMTGWTLTPYGTATANTGAAAAGTETTGANDSLGTAETSLKALMARSERKIADVGAESKVANAANSTDQSNSGLIGVSGNAQEGLKRVQSSMNSLAAAYSGISQGLSVNGSSSRNASKIVDADLSDAGGANALGAFTQLRQAGTAMLTKANSAPGSVIRLLG